MNAEGEEPTSKDRLKAINERIAEICVDFDAIYTMKIAGFGHPRPNSSVCLSGFWMNLKGAQAIM